MRHWIGVLALALTACSATADRAGFAISDLTEVKVELRDFDMLGPNCEVAAAPDRLTLACVNDGVLDVVDIEFEQTRDDGTEARVRNGTTSYQDLDAQCRARNASCRVEKLEVAPAVGWVSVFDGLGGPSQTALVWNQGQALSVQVFSPSKARTAALMAAARERLLPQILLSR